MLPTFPSSLFSLWGKLGSSSAYTGFFLFRLMLIVLMSHKSPYTSFLISSRGCSIVGSALCVALSLILPDRRVMMSLFPFRIVPPPPPSAPEGRRCQLLLTGPQ